MGGTGRVQKVMSSVRKAIRRRGGAGAGDGVGDEDNNSGGYGAGVDDGPDGPDGDRETDRDEAPFLGPQVNRARTNPSLPGPLPHPSPSFYGEQRHLDLLVKPKGLVLGDRVVLNARAFTQVGLGLPIRMLSPWLAPSHAAKSCCRARRC